MDGDSLGRLLKSVQSIAKSRQTLGDMFELLCHLTAVYKQTLDMVRTGEADEMMKEAINASSVRKMDEYMMIGDMCALVAKAHMIVIKAMHATTKEERDKLCDDMNKEILERVEHIKSDLDEKKDKGRPGFAFDICMN